MAEATATQSTLRALRSDPPLVMSVAEAAVYLGVSVNFLRDKIGRGIIPVSKLGRRILIRRGDLDATLTRLAHE